MTERNQRGGPRRFYARPADRSLEAYKRFLEYMAESLGVAPDLSEDELRRAWQNFWEAADSETRGEKTNTIFSRLLTGRKSGKNASMATSQGEFVGCGYFP